VSHSGIRTIFSPEQRDIGQDIERRHHQQHRQEQLFQQLPVPVPGQVGEGEDDAAQDQPPEEFGLGGGGPVDLPPEPAAYQAPEDEEQAEYILPAAEIVPPAEAAAHGRQHRQDRVLPQQLPGGIVAGEAHDADKRVAKEGPHQQPARQTVLIRNPGPGNGQRFHGHPPHVKYRRFFRQHLKL